MGNCALSLQTVSFSRQILSIFLKKRATETQQGAAVFLGQRYTLTDRLVSRARSFITERSPDPFFLYLPLVHTHVPHTPSNGFLRAAAAAGEGAAHVPYAAALREVACLFNLWRNVCSLRVRFSNSRWEILWGHLITCHH